MWLGQETGHNGGGGAKTHVLANVATGRRTRVACAALGVVILLGGIVFKLKTKNFELTVEVPDAEARQAQDTAKADTTQANVSTKKSNTLSDADPNRRAVELLRAWDSPPEIMLAGGDWLRGDALRQYPLPKTSFKIRAINFNGADADRLGDGLADALAEPLRGARVDGTLHVNINGLSTAGLAKLVRLPAFSEVTSLYLHGDRLDDGLFAELAKLPKLTNLDVNDCRQVTGKGLSALRSLPDFSILTLVSCPVSADALHELRSLPHLRYLNLDGVPLTDAHVAELAELPIKDMILGSTGLDDRQAERLARNESLNKLVLLGNDKITDQLLPTLKQFAWLRELDFSAPGVTEAAAAELQQALPNCKVVWRPKPKP